MLNNRFGKLQHAFDTDHVNYWSNLSRINNLLVELSGLYFWVVSVIYWVEHGSV